jgi:hypothetical protein
VSVPKRIWHKTASEMRQIAMFEAKMVGFDGGSCIYYSKRKNALKGLSFSPHFRFLGYGWIDGDKVIERHDKTGFIFKNNYGFKGLPFF